MKWAGIDPEEAAAAPKSAPKKEARGPPLPTSLLASLLRKSRRCAWHLWLKSEDAPLAPTQEAKAAAPAGGFFGGLAALFGGKK